MMQAKDRHNFANMKAALDQVQTAAVQDNEIVTHAWANVGEMGYEMCSAKSHN